MGFDVLFLINDFESVLLMFHPYWKIYANGINMTLLECDNKKYECNFPQYNNSLTTIVEVNQTVSKFINISLL